MDNTAQQNPNPQIQQPQTPPIPPNQTPQPPLNPNVDGKKKFPIKAIIITIVIYLLVGLVIVGFIYGDGLKRLFFELLPGGIENSKVNSESNDYAGPSGSEVFDKTGENIESKEDFTISTPFHKEEDGRFLTTSNPSEYKSAAGGFSVKMSANQHYTQTPGDLIIDLDKVDIVDTSTYFENYSIEAKNNRKQDGNSKYSNPKEYLDEYVKNRFSSPPLSTTPLEKFKLNNKEAYKTKVTAKEYPSTIIIAVFNNDIIYLIFGRETDKFQKFLSTFKFEEKKFDPTSYWFKLRLERLYFKLPLGWPVRESGYTINKPQILTSNQLIFIGVDKNVTVDDAIKNNRLSTNNPSSIISEVIVDGRSAKQLFRNYIDEDGEKHASKHLFIQVDLDTYEIYGSSNIWLPYEKFLVVFDQILSTIKFTNEIPTPSPTPTPTPTPTCTPRPECPEGSYICVQKEPAGGWCP